MFLLLSMKYNEKNFELLTVKGIYSYCFNLWYSIRFHMYSVQMVIKKMSLATKKEQIKVKNQILFVFLQKNMK